MSTSRSASFAVRKPFIFSVGFGLLRLTVKCLPLRQLEMLSRLLPPPPPPQAARNAQTSTAAMDASPHATRFLVTGVGQIDGIYPQARGPCKPRPAGGGAGR